MTLLLLHGFGSTPAADFPPSRWSPAIAPALPGHEGGPPIPGTIGLAEVLRALAADVPPGPVDVVGYSLGARLAWSLAVEQVVPVRRLVLGGLSPRDPFAAADVPAIRAAVTEGSADPLTAGLATVAGRGDTESLLRLIEGLGKEPFDPAGRVPEVPTLFLAGTDDVLVQGIEEVAARLPDARLRRVPGDHFGALTGEEFRTAVTEFLTD